MKSASRRVNHSEALLVHKACEKIKVLRNTEEEENDEIVKQTQESAFQREGQIEAKD